MADEQYEDARDYYTPNPDPDEDKPSKYPSEIGKIIESSDKHYLISIKRIDMLVEHIHVWNGVMKDKDGIVCNRRRNKQKIDEIYNAIKNKTLASSIISASEFISSDKMTRRYLCWDGQHRLWALRKYYNRDSKVEFTGNIYLMIYRNDKRKNMVERFKNINMGTPAQAHYSSTLVKNTVEAITGIILKKYPSLNKSSGSPQRPNYNINNVHMDLSTMLNNLDVSYVTPDIINKCINFIDIINSEIKEKYENRYARRVKDRWLVNAEIADCYLFLDNDFVDQLKDKIIA